MNLDIKRLNQYLYEIKENTDDLKNILQEFDIQQILKDKRLIKAIKFSIVEIAEAISLVLQHLIAKLYGMPVKGYIDTIKKAYEKEIIPLNIYESLKPFFDFRNTLIHRYWDVKDELLIENLKNNYKNFYEFIDIIRERFIKINEKNV
jgi:uncharacterized protein YutE (UPF0331/DUF86 family)